MSELGNQFKSQTLDEVIATSFNTVGGRVFPDLGSQTGLKDFIAIVKAWQSTHAQTFGAPIPNSGYAINGSGATLGDKETIVAALDNEVILVQALSCINGGAGTVGYEIKLGDTLINSGTITAGSATTIDLNFALYISKGQDLTITPTSGTPTDLVFDATALKTVQ